MAVALMLSLPAATTATALVLRIVLRLRL